MVYPAPKFSEFLKHTISYPLHPWQAKHLVPLLESLVPDPPLQEEESQQNPPPADKENTTELRNQRLHHPDEAGDGSEDTTHKTQDIAPWGLKSEQNRPQTEEEEVPDYSWLCPPDPDYEMENQESETEAGSNQEPSSKEQNPKAATLSQPDNEASEPIGNSRASVIPDECEERSTTSGRKSQIGNRGKRILVHAPPQYGKSILVSKRFPAWALGKNPMLRIVIAGYNEGHACEFAEVVRDIMAGDIYRDMFPNPRCRVRANAKREAFSTAARISRKEGEASIRAVGLGTGFTGRGADILIIDDPYASPDDARSEAINEKVWRWWNELAKVRINDQTHVIVMFHRYHEDDFAGRLLAEGGWKYIRFPAIADENEDKSDPTRRKPGELLSPMRSRAFLKQIEDRDPMVWLGQFQGRPRAPEGAFIHREWLKSIAPNEVPRTSLLVRFWDLATKADQSGDFFAGALVGVGPDQTIYLYDVTRFKAEWPDAKEIISEVTRRDCDYVNDMGAGYEVGVESVAWMRTMVQEMFQQPIFKAVRLTPVKPNGDKKERASGWVARAKNGMFTMVKDHWNSDFVQECIAFDGFGTCHDDQVDAVSGAYHLIWDLKGGLVEDDPIPAIGTYDWWQEYFRINNLNVAPKQEWRDPDEDDYEWWRD